MMNIQLLFRRSRIHLALWYAVIMGGILGLSGFGVYRSIVQSNWVALEQEIESIAGTLHDSLEPMLPVSGDPTIVLQQIFPDLCLVDQLCNTNYIFAQRHTRGITDRNIYYIRLFDYHGKLIAFSPNQPSRLSSTLNSTPWQTIDGENGVRYRQFTTILHSADGNLKKENHSSWGYLQIGRTLISFDSETERIKWILITGFFIALILVTISSWWLSGLAMQPIYQSYEKQQQFTANVSHELRSPLASLLATVEAIIRLGHHQQNTQTLLYTIERQGRRLSNLIADLLLLTSLEQNSSQKPFKPCCLNDLVTDLTEEFLELAIASDINLTSQISPVTIYTLGDESQLYRLVSNLISNAIQYTSKRGDIIISLEYCNCKAVIKVKDTGIGIPLDQQNRIFDRFYRVDGDRSRKTGGTGLGLAIAKAIAQKHQGYLTVESIVGEGSVFTLEIMILPFLSNSESNIKE